MQSETRIKACSLCGQDCSNCRRVRDDRGRYYCADCHELARRRRQAARSTQDSAAETMARVLAETPATRRCVRCTEPLMPSAVLCTNCGFDQRSGVSYQSTVETPRDYSSTIPPAIGKWEDLLQRQEADAERAARRDYIVPGAMLFFGVGSVLALLFIASSDVAPAVLAGGYLLGLGIEVVVGVIGLFVAAHLWLGGAGPLRLGVLRLAGIYAVIDAVTLVVAPLLIIGWLIRICVYVGLLSSLFELDWRDSAMLAMVTFTLKVAVGFGLFLLL